MRLSPAAQKRARYMTFRNYITLQQIQAKRYLHQLSAKK